MEEDRRQEQPEDNKRGGGGDYGREESGGEEEEGELCSTDKWADEGIDAAEALMPLPPRPPAVESASTAASAAEDHDTTIAASTIIEDTEKNGEGEDAAVSAAGGAAGSGAAGRRGVTFAAGSFEFDDDSPHPPLPVRGPAGNSNSPQRSAVPHQIIVTTTTATMTGGNDCNDCDAPDTRASIHFGDDDFDVVEEYGEATWTEVGETCCCHPLREWLLILFGVGLVLFFLYWFLFSLNILSRSARVMTGCIAGQLFGGEAGINNPVASLMVGILATVLLQSSSTTTSIIVSLVGTDALISVEQAIYMVMGANIGTTVTNTLVAMGQMGDRRELERAFAGATIHDLFNFMTVAVLFPVEVVTGYLQVLTSALIRRIDSAGGGGGDETADGGGGGERLVWIGPVARIVWPMSDKIVIANQELIHAVAEGTGSCALGDGFYPIQCYDPSHPTYDSCPTRGLVTCSNRTDACPAFFDPSATVHDDKVSGGVVFFFAICFLFVCLYGLIAVLQRMLLGISTRIVYKATDVNGYVAMLAGAAITVVVQSSSITTSTLTPLVGIGMIRLEQMYPLTLGCNLGTTVTAIMAATVTDGTDALQVALAHTFFNVSGVLIFYVVPFMRRIPIYAARQLGRASGLWCGFPIIYIAVMFFGIPLVFLGLSFMFQQKTTGLTVAASLIAAFIGILCIVLFGWCHCRGGKARCTECFRRRERERVTLSALPDDIDYLLDVVEALIRHTRLSVGDDDDDGDERERHDEEYERNITWQRRRRLIRVLPDDMEYLKSTIAALVEHTCLPFGEWERAEEKDTEATHGYSEELQQRQRQRQRPDETVERRSNNSYVMMGGQSLIVDHQEYLNNPVGRRPVDGESGTETTQTEIVNDPFGRNGDWDDGIDVDLDGREDEEDDEEEEEEEEEDGYRWRFLPLILYSFGLFIVLPLIVYALVVMFEQGTLSLTALASFLTTLVALAILSLSYRCRLKGGDQQCIDYVVDCERKRDVLRDLPEDLVYLQSKTAALIRHTNLCVTSINDHDEFGVDDHDYHGSSGEYPIEDNE